MSAGDYSGRYEALMDEARSLDHGAAQVALYEEAVRLADHHGDLGLAYDARDELIESANFSGFPEKAMVAFTWCLGQCDRNPGRFDEPTLLWKYKWVIASLDEFPQITRAQIDAAVEDMDRRFRAHGSTGRAVLKLRAKLAVAMGDVDEARRHYEAWKTARRDWVTDCEACERDEEVHFRVAFGEDERAVEVAGPILSGRMKCAEVPHITLAKVLLPLFRLGRLGEAAAHHRKGYRLIARNRSFLGEIPPHMTFLALTANHTRAKKLLESHLGWALESRELASRFQFDLAAMFFLDRLRASGKTSDRLRLPQSFPGHREGGRYDVDALASWFAEDARGLAARFDARNGNDAYSRRLNEHEALATAVVPFPLEKAGGKGTA